MKNTLIFFFLFWLATLFNVAAQNLYFQDFNSVTPPALPSQWASSSSTTQTIGQIAGDNTGNTLFTANCSPSGQNRTVTVSSISTIAWSSITVSFIHRRTGAFDVPITLSWSIDGTNWNVISSNILPSSVSTWEGYTSSILPSGADNQSNLRIRWSWTTNTNASCLTATPNYRIDDFSVDALVAPVTWLAFKATTSSSSVKLDFATATEHDNAYFAIEHSTNGNTFREIGQTPSLGNSRSPQTYTYTDRSPAKGTNYYRLRQVDTDGTWSYSPVVTAVLSSNSMQIYPTTATDMLRIISDEALTEDHFWQVFDLAGRVYQAGTWEAESAQYELMVNELPQGNYVIRLTAGQQNPIVLRFQKR